MKKHLQVTYINGWSREEWLAFRERGLGASDIGAMMGHSQYTSKLQLFLEKTGQWQVDKSDNLHTYMGKRLEDLIAEEWAFLTPGEPLSIIRNRENPDYIPRKCRRINAYVSNPQWPWLFVSLDRVITKGNVNHLTGEINVSESDLELKTISGFESNKWEAGIPTGYVLQLQTQLGVCEMDYGEIAILKDGKYLDVISFDFNPTIFNDIVETSREFWTKVMEARKLIAELKAYEAAGNRDMADSVTAMLQVLEPDPDGTPAYNDFLKERYRIGLPESVMPGTPELVQAAVAAELNWIQWKGIEEKACAQENIIKTIMQDTEKIDFGKDLGYVSWKTNAKGHRVFQNKIKLQPALAYLEKEKEVNA